MCNDRPCYAIIISISLAVGLISAPLKYIRFCWENAERGNAENIKRTRTIPSRARYLLLRATLITFRAPTPSTSTLSYCFTFTFFVVALLLDNKWCLLYGLFTRNFSSTPYIRCSSPPVAILLLLVFVTINNQKYDSTSTS